MPQIFQVLRCYKCLVFQVHQTKKSNKLECKLCGEKQSIKRHYGIGTAKDCRLHVQKLNGIRGEMEGLETKSEDRDEVEKDENINEISIKPNIKMESKWSEYVQKTEEIIETKEPMFLDNTEVVLELPTKKRRKFFKTPLAVKPQNSTSIESTLINDNSLRTNKTDTAMSKILKQTNNKKILTTKTKLFVTKLNPQRNYSESEINDCKIKDSKLQVENVQCNYGSDDNVKPEFVEKNAPKFVPHKILSNSKWAQYAHEGDNDDAAPTLIEHNPVRATPSSHSHNYQNLFFLCNDNELDSILDF